jgi:hypothetical protein
MAKKKFTTSTLEALEKDFLSAAENVPADLANGDALKHSYAGVAQQIGALLNVMQNMESLAEPRVVEE